MNLLNRLAKLPQQAWDAASFLWDNPAYFSPGETKLHAWADLACDAVEALFQLFSFQAAADELWDWTYAERLAKAEEQHEVWEPKSSVAAPQVSADSAATEPPGGSVRPQRRAAGHPNQKLLAAAAHGLREFADSRYCEAPNYWLSIADQLAAK